MTEQVSLWQNEQQSVGFAELCNALYERELQVLAHAPLNSPNAIQARLKSLPYYIKRTAHLMISVESPLILDTQNATWSSKQSRAMPLASQTHENIWHWYASIIILPGLVVPIAVKGHIILDSVDRVDQKNNRFRTNAYGWFQANSDLSSEQQYQLLKPTKKVMMAACSGHFWQENGKLNTVVPSLRELLLSCSINWRNFKQPLVLS